ncbi:MAG: rhomboid family intramembrane serine protease, partial [Verrucomicrobiae bacterium]|nr:rhomboid family intramembrane serine protease [Verrucomicrobiae bacterium]
HILINLLILWFLGREVEYFIGPKYFTRLYLLGGVMGAALWLAFNYHAPAHVVGASAAVLACAIAFATLFPDREITLLLFFVLPVTIKAKYLAWGLVALDIVPLLQHATTGVAHLAHLGGALLGYLYIKQLGYGPQPRWLRWWERMTDRLKPRRRLGVRARRVSEREMTPDEFIREKVDPILDKIAREGIHSLTRAERKILESAKDYLRKR